MALMLSIGMATATQGASLAFANEGADQTQDPAPQTAEQAIPLAKTSASACIQALYADLDGNSSLLEKTITPLDPEAERASRVESLIAEAMAHVGTPYAYGGTTPSGFDCSGFTGYVFNKALGVELPRTAAAQSGVAERISLDEAERGDLLFWGNGGVYHTGIYLGDGEYVHASPRKGIVVQSMAAYCPTFAAHII